jgi:hypothetical protein
MRVLLLVAAVIALIAVVRQARVARRRPALPSGRASPVGGTQSLRLVVLRRAFLGGVAPAPSGEPRAVVMDWGLDNGAASLVAYDDDTTRFLGGRGR